MYVLCFSYTYCTYSNDGNSTGDELASILLYTMGPIIREIQNDDVIGEAGILIYTIIWESIAPAIHLNSCCF